MSARERSNEPRRLAVSDLRDIVRDPSELAKGARIFDGGDLAHLARHERKLFADAEGSGSAPYKVQIVFDERDVRARCSCIAARTRPFCKHAAGLLVAWSRAPESFAEAVAPPPGAAGDARRKQVKKGRVEAADLMARGVEQVTTLVRELAVAGVAALAADRAEQVRGLGAALREARLRRLSARTLELADHLARAAARSDLFDPNEYAGLLGDMLLTARKLEKHVAGEPLADEHVEELVGKTWTKKDRKPIAGLELVEYAFMSRTTSDGYVVRESRFVDLASGEHFCEKQILPGFLARRTNPKPSWAGRVLAGASGSVYPSFSPRRLDLEETGTEARLDHAAVARLVEGALPTAGAALSRLQESRRDLFAPDTVPVALRADTVLADGARMQVVDETGAALFLPDERDAAEALARALRGPRLAALLGDVAVDGALPTLFPLAAAVEERGVLALVPLARLDAAVLLESRKVRARAAREQRGRAARWVEIARQAGASGAALVLGEVREELAQALASGLATVVPRLTEPLASRLRDLSLARQADLLSRLSARSDPADKLDDLVKLHQVLGMALARLAGAAQVDRAALEPVPTCESVHVRRAAAPLGPAEVAALQGAGKLNRFEAAVHHARHYESMSPEALAGAIYPTWADGSAAPYVAAALARAPAAAIEAARRVLEPDAAPARAGWQRSTARAARLTAIRVLAAAGTREAAGVLAAAARRREADPALAAHAERALAGGVEPEARTKTRDHLSYGVLNASVVEGRVSALRALADGAFVEAIPIVRASFAGDLSGEVRKEAAYALARLGDVESVETMVEMLRERGRAPEEAKVAARALGMLGDVRGLDELLRAWAEGWHPAIVGEAIREVGAAALEPMVRMLEEMPRLAERKAALGVIAALPAADVAGVLVARLEGGAGGDDFCKRAGFYLSIAASQPEAAALIVRRIVELQPALLDRSRSSSDEKSLARKCAKYL